MNTWDVHDLISVEEKKTKTKKKRSQEIMKS